MTYWEYPGRVKVIPTEERIIKRVCKFYNITPAQLKTKTNKREIVTPRQACCKLIRDSGSKMSLRVVGEMLGGIDHATVLHGIKTINNLVATDRHFRAQFNLLKNSL